MRRIHRALWLVTLLAIAPALSGCANGEFDFDKLDIFGLNEKKKLPGERKDLFPEGVPGVQQGIPPEYLKENQIAAEQAAAQTAAVAPPEEEKPKPPQAKPKPKPRTAARPTRVDIGGGSQAAPVQQQQQQPAQADQPSNASPWPATPAPGTFTR